MLAHVSIKAENTSMWNMQHGGVVRKHSLSQNNANKKTTKQKHAQTPWKHVTKYHSDAKKLFQIIKNNKYINDSFYAVAGESFDS